MTDRTHPGPHTVLDAALDLLAHGYSVVPIRPDGSKAPALAGWRRHMAERATVDDVHAWFARDAYDLGVVQGAVSGDAELTELEGRAAAHVPALEAAAHRAGHGELWSRLLSGWVEESPSGGLHVHYRLADGPVPGSTRLACDPHRAVLAETRGEGGQVVVAPSRHHASGRPWVRLHGGPATAPVVTRQERDAFHAVLRTLDVPRPAAGAAATRTWAGRPPRDHPSPGDDFEARTDWAAILVPHGWTLVTAHGRTRYWLRPGKPPGSGVSATTGHADDRDRLFVFSTSTVFDAQVPYTKLGALAVLEHRGDHAAAATALRALGYGRPPAGALAPARAGRARVDVAAPGAPDPSTGRVLVHEHARRPEPNEDSTALLLVDAHRDTIRYCPGRGRWLVWTGHRWADDDQEHVRELARGVARRLPDGEEWRAYGRRARSSAGVSGVVRLARSDARVVAPVERLDARPYELNTPAGVVDLRSGRITAPDPEALHTRSTAVAPDPGAHHPAWSQFLADTFGGDEDLARFVQRLVGLSLVGVVLEQVLPFAHGAGANGKTTLMSVVQRVVGMGETGYAMSAPASMLVATRSEGHPTELARLSGARLVVTSELEDGQRFAEAKIKLLTGKDTITGRFMRQDWFDFTPTHTLWLLANHRPDVRAGGVAFWRRLRLVPFEHTVPPELRVPDLEDRLVEEEGPAILSWAVRGAVDYFTGGMREPARVVDATRAYERDQDSLARFVEECCRTGSPGAQHLRVRSGVLRRAYERWCLVEGEEPVSVKAMTTALRIRHGVVPERSSSTRFLAGIRLVDDEAGVPSRDSDPSSTRPEGWRPDVDLARG